MSILEPMIEELDREAAATRRLLERLPEDRLGWRPHEKAMTLGQLALHVAEIPGDVSGMVGRDRVPPPDFGDLPQPASHDEVLRSFVESVAAAKSALDALDEARARSTWSIVRDGEELMSMPRHAALRFILLNHWYHHRGQLALYLRMLGREVPATYGASADEVRMGPEGGR